jgi:hypothetical protein
MKRFFFFSIPCCYRLNVFPKLRSCAVILALYGFLTSLSAIEPLMHLPCESILVENQKHFFADQITGNRAEILCSLKIQDQLSDKPATATGLKGMAFRAGGNGQYGRFLELHTEQLQNASPFTIVLWFKSLAVQHSTCLLYYKNSWSTKPGFMLRMDGSQLRLLVVPEAGKPAVCIASNRPLNPIQMNSWYFVALSWDGDCWTMHLNGEKLVASAEANEFVNVSSGTPLRIGGYNIHTNNIFQGLIDE